MLAALHQVLGREAGAELSPRLSSSEGPSPHHHQTEPRARREVRQLRAANSSQQGLILHSLVKALRLQAEQGWSSVSSRTVVRTPGRGRAQVCPGSRGFSVGCRPGQCHGAGLDLAKAAQAMCEVALKAASARRWHLSNGGKFLGATFPKDPV